MVVVVGCVVVDFGFKFGVCVGGCCFRVDCFEF